MSSTVENSKGAGARSRRFLGPFSRKSPEPDPTRFKDVFILIAATVLFSIVLAAFRAINLGSQIADDEAQARQLKEQLSAMTQRVSDSKDARSRADAESRLPHPTLTDRDANVIGYHTNVSWNYSGNDAKHVSYELQLMALKRFRKDCDKTTDILKCEDGGRFIATDSGLQTSRIPPGEEKTIVPGTYAWRVAAVPIGAAVEPRVERDDPKRISEWSAYATFTLQPSIVDRIVDTGRVRVGTNLEQHTRFGYWDGLGNVAGFDISLVNALLDGCLGRDTKTRRLIPKEKACTDAMTAEMEQIDKHMPRELLPQAGSCSKHPPAKDGLCFDFIPVAKWNDWEGALSRKEIDLFVGGVTASQRREGRGIGFTRGYLSFNSRLYIRATDLPGQASLDAWLTRDRVVGAVVNSSNEALLDEIIAARKNDNTSAHVKKPDQPFRTYPALEAAMDRGEIDGVVLDETFVTHEDWKPLEDFSPADKNARDTYIRTFVGPIGEEQVAIAVANDSSPAIQSLAEILSSELQSPPIKKFVKTLCAEFWPPSAHGYNCRTP